MKFQLSTIFTGIGFGSAVLLIWFLLIGWIEVGLWLGMGAFIFFVLLGFGGAFAEAFQENLNKNPK